MIKRFAPILFALAVVGCSTPATVTQPAASETGFHLDLVLSPQASAQLQKRGEAIVVSAAYSGPPTAAAQSQTNDIGTIDLTDHPAWVVVPAESHRIDFKGLPIGAARLAMLDGPVMVNVNVFSARKSSDDNLLACDFIDGQLLDVQRHSPITIHCYLITENPTVSHRP